MALRAVPVVYDSFGALGLSLKRPEAFALEPLHAIADTYVCLDELGMRGVALDLLA